MLRWATKSRFLNLFTFTAKKTQESTPKNTSTDKTPELDNTPEPGFLEMVEAYFEKAGNLTDISKDKLHFYKKSENTVKFHLTLKRGNSSFIQTMEQLK